MKLNTLATAMGLATTITVTPAHAGVGTYNWNGIFTLLTSDGNPLVNDSIASSKSAPANQFHTPISGTMQFDDITGAGTATVNNFDFFSNQPTGPMEAVGFNMQAIGDGMGGPGTLVLGNMLFNWNGHNGLPVSIVMDAAGFFASQDAGTIGLFGDPWTDGVLNNSDNLIQNTGAVPASDGIYISSTYPDTVTGPGGYTGYLGLGPLPIATTAWNTTNGPGCSMFDCLHNAVSGVLPLVLDTAPQTADYIANTGGTIGGSPMQDGAFPGINGNFQFTELTSTGYDAEAEIAPFCEFGIACPATVPIPSAVWLFGSGLVGLIGLARRKADI
jgi:hypothetical protein